MCSELSDQNDTEVWITIHRCLALEPKNFLRLSLETKNLLIDKLITNLSEYPESQVLEEMLKCCNYIFSSVNVQNYSKETKFVCLMKVLFTFATTVLNNNESKESNRCVKSSLAVESAEHAIGTFAQICKQNLAEKASLTIIFIEELLFPLASLVETIKTKEVPSKIVMEIQKSIKRLLLTSVKSITTVETNDEKIKEIEVIFNALKSKASTAKLEEIKAAFTCLFQCVINTFQQNSALIDIILRKLAECTGKKEHFNQVLISLLENSVDVSYNFDNEIEGVTLKTFLKNEIEEITSKKKRFKCSDYQLLSAITKLNPLIVEDITQSILERILFETKSCEKEEVACEHLIRELWKASVRLRRQHKFLSKFLLSFTSYEEEEIEDLEWRNKFELSTTFVVEFSEDLKSRTTSAQILAMFHTLLFHLKSDCTDKLKTSGSTSELLPLYHIIIITPYIIFIIREYPCFF